MWGDWILGPALCFIGVLPLAVARAELWRLRAARPRGDAAATPAAWVAILGAALAQFIAVAALTVDTYGHRRAAVFELIGVAACLTFLRLRGGNGLALAAPRRIMGLGFAAGLLAILLAAANL